MASRGVKRSREARERDLERIDLAVANGPARRKLGCANFAHGFAAVSRAEQGASIFAL